MIPEPKDPKYSTKKLIDLINIFSKVAGYKINPHNLVAFLYIIPMTFFTEMEKSILKVT
jgi:hypothetical protein